jgi:hypothetical protein
MTYAHGGVAALKALMASGRTTAQLRAGLEKALGMPWSEIGPAWRAHILEYALSPQKKKG